MNENGSPSTWRQRLICTISFDVAGKLQHGADVVGRLDAAHLDGDHFELLDALVQVLEESAVFDRLQDFRQLRRDERPLALHLDQQFFPHQLAQRLADGDAAHLQLAPQLVFGRDLQPDVVLPGRDAMPDDLFDLVIEGNDPVFAAAGVDGLVLTAAWGGFRH